MVIAVVRAPCSLCRHILYYYVTYHYQKKDVTVRTCTLLDSRIRPNKRSKFSSLRRKRVRVSNSSQYQTKITNRLRDFDVSQQCRLISDRIWGDFDFESRSKSRSVRVRDFGWCGVGCIVQHFLLCLTLLRTERPIHADQGR